MIGVLGHNSAPRKFHITANHFGIIVHPWYAGFEGGGGLSSCLTEILAAKILAGVDRKLEALKA